MTKVKLSEIIPTRTSVIIETKEQFDKVVNGFGVTEAEYKPGYLYYRFGKDVNGKGYSTYSSVSYTREHMKDLADREIHFVQIDFEEKKPTRYIVPQDYYGGAVKKGEIVQWDDYLYASYCVRHSNQSHWFPPELVETWEPEQPRITIPSGEYTRDQLESFIQQLK